MLRLSSGWDGLGWTGLGWNGMEWNWVKDACLGLPMGLCTWGEEGLVGTDTQARWDTAWGNARLLTVEIEEVW